MDKEEVKELIESYHEAYMQIVKTFMSEEQQKIYAMYENGVCMKKQSLETDLNRLFEDTDEPDISAIQEMLEHSLGLMNETFRDAHIFPKERADWYNRFKSEINDLSEHKNRPGLG